MAIDNNRPEHPQRTGPQERTQRSSRLQAPPEPAERDARYFERIPHGVAHYRETNLPKHKQNPYVLALPELSEDAALTKVLSNLPRFNAEERKLPLGQRLTLLGGLNNIFVATARHTRLMRAMMKLMIQGYERRNPNTAVHRARIAQTYETMMAAGTYQRVDPYIPAQLSMGIAGAAGVGKTYTLRNIMSLVTPAIYHSELGIWQLPFLYIEMPYDGESLHTLASSIFEELDRLLPGENYGKVYITGSHTNAQNRLAQALKVAAEHGVGMLVIDEQQNQRYIGKKRSSRSSHNLNAAVNLPKNETPLMKLLITASNKANMPLCMVGTLESQYIVGARFTRGRRMSGNGSALWLPLQPSFDLSKDNQGEFEQTMQALWKYQWVRKPCEISPQMHELFWRLTQGLPDLMVKLFSAAQEAAIVSETEQITPALLQGVYDSQFWAAHLGLEALRSGDEVLTDAVPDIHHPTRSPAFRLKTLEALVAFRERNKLPVSDTERATLADARKARAAALKMEQAEGAQASKSAKAAASLKRAVDVALDSDDAAMASKLAQQALLAGINPAGAPKRA